MEEQLSPYWSPDLDSAQWKPVTWQTPDYQLALGVIRHGNVFSLTQSEHAALRGADVTSIALRSTPTRRTYAPGEPLDLTGLVVTADYSDGLKDELLLPGRGGYVVSGYDPTKRGQQQIDVSYTVVDQTRTASFAVTVK